VDESGLEAMLSIATLSDALAMCTGAPARFQFNSDML
jgi:hypothetical protein